MSERSRIRVAVAGDGELAERWLEAAQFITDARRTSGDLPEATDALIVAPGTADPFGRTKEALLAGLHVLHAAPFCFSPWQAGALSELSQRQRRILRFVEPFQCQPGFSFLQRLLRGREPLWRPLYLRMLRLSQQGGPGRIDELATEELAICEALLEGTPRHMTAAASRRDAAGAVCAVVLVLQYSEGPLVQCTISLAEAREASQLVAVTPTRSVIMDDSEPALRIMDAGGGHDLPAGGPAVPAANADRSWPRRQDVPTEEMGRFVRAVRTGDRSIANSERWVAVASLWWAARQSISFDGPAEVPVPSDAGPPPLQVIEGGGKSAPSPARRPSLKVVAG